MTTRAVSARIPLVPTITMMSPDRYLARIEYAGPRTPDAATLAALQRAHLLHVPYENLDLYERRETTLATEELYDKIVDRHRGGYCFELNGLFAWLLRQLGFTVTEHFGRWLAGELLPVPKRRHRVLRVAIGDETWIADVGVGRRAPLAPLRLQHGLLQPQDGLAWRIIHDPHLGHVVQQQAPNGDFTNFYSFDDAPQENLDFTYAHYYYAHAPGSIFLQKLILHLPTADGRNSLATEPDPETGLPTPCLHISQEGAPSVARFLHTPAQLDEALRDYFGIVR